MAGQEEPSTPHIRKYWTFREGRGPTRARQHAGTGSHRSVADGIISKGACVVVPATLQPGILDKLHTANQGIEKSRLRARTSVYWSNINADIEEMVDKCGTCQEAQHTQQREPIVQHEVPTRAWQTVGTDLCSIGQRNHLIIADYYSKYPFVKEVQGRVTSRAIVNLT